VTSQCTICIPNGDRCAAHREFKVGDAVRISRDENIYAPKGTWSRHRSKPGFVVVVSPGAGPHGATEYGVILTTTHPQWRKEPGREHELNYDSDAVLWFAPHELVAR
jgi:hypothetical protein